jgi:hypothetical protein
LQVVVPRKLSEIENDAMELSRHDRALLAKHLLATLDPGDDADVEELWIEEAERWHLQRIDETVGTDTPVS